MNRKQSFKKKKSNKIKTVLVVTAVLTFIICLVVSLRVHVPAGIASTEPAVLVRKYLDLDEYVEDTRNTFKNDIEKAATGIGLSAAQIETTLLSRQVRTHQERLREITNYMKTQDLQVAEHNSGNHIASLIEITPNSKKLTQALILLPGESLEIHSQLVKNSEKFLELSCLGASDERRDGKTRIEVSWNRIDFLEFQIPSNGERQSIQGISENEASVIALRVPEEAPCALAIWSLRTSVEQRTQNNGVIYITIDRLLEYPELFSKTLAKLRELYGSDAVKVTHPIWPLSTHYAENIFEIAKGTQWPKREFFSQNRGVQETPLPIGLTQNLKFQNMKTLELKIGESRNCLIGSCQEDVNSSKKKTSSEFGTVIVLERQNNFLSLLPAYFGSRVNLNNSFVQLNFLTEEMNFGLTWDSALESKKSISSWIKNGFLSNAFAAKSQETMIFKEEEKSRQIDSSLESLFQTLTPGELPQIVILTQQLLSEHSKYEFAALPGHLITAGDSATTTSSRLNAPVIGQHAVSHILHGALKANLEGDDFAHDSLINVGQPDSELYLYSSDKQNLQWIDLPNHNSFKDLTGVSSNIELSQISQKLKDLAKLRLDAKVHEIHFYFPATQESEEFSVSLNTTQPIAQCYKNTNVSVAQSLKTEEFFSLTFTVTVAQEKSASVVCVLLEELKETDSFSARILTRGKALEANEIGIGQFAKSPQTNEEFGMYTLQGKNIYHELIAEVFPNAQFHSTKKVFLWRAAKLRPKNFPPEGFEPLLNQEELRALNPTPID